MRVVPDKSRYMRFGFQTNRRLEMFAREEHVPHHRSRARGWASSWREEFWEPHRELEPASDKVGDAYVVGLFGSLNPTRLRRRLLRRSERERMPPPSVPCPTCGKMFFPHSLGMHTAQCSIKMGQQLEGCPACGMSVPRNQMNAHLNTCKAAREMMGIATPPPKK